MIVVRFPDVEPWFPLPRIKKKVIEVEKFIRSISYGKVRLSTMTIGWLELPAPLDDYKVSPFNFEVDRQRVRRLLVDSLSKARTVVDPNNYDYIWVVVGTITRPGRGYGMIAYAANPGMLSGVRHGRAR
ncbi:MAG: hypothetical protein HKM88_01555, partial [Halobacteria archaeon]|nr:hypothetical protein [Halobacteria archaeon]